MNCQQRLQKALMDRKMMEIILTEAEEGYKKAVAKTDLLEIEVNYLICICSCKSACVSLP